MAPSDLASFLSGEPPAADAGVIERRPATTAAPQTPGDASPGRAGSGAGSAKVILNDRFEIDPANPLPDFDHVGADAFDAKRLGASKAKLFAYVARSGLPARQEMLAPLRAIEHANVLNLVTHGVAHWPPDGVQRLIVIFERPARRMVESIDAEATPMREDEVVRMVIGPVAAALEELWRLRVVHGAINPANLYLTGGEVQRTLLGDCVTTPSGFAQPAAFETIGRSMATPAGRGNATFADDLYALGVSMVFLVLGRLPGAGLDPRSLITAKIESGSFNALVGNGTLPQVITEPIRGLLLDDPKKRWSLEDLQIWLGGRRQSPRRSEVVGRLQKPVTFLGRDYLNVRSLAVAMADDTAAADAIIEDGTLEGSLARSIDDDDLQIRIVDAKRTAVSGRAGSLPERRVARVLMALDPQAPIRYRGQSVMLDGIGPALAQAVVTGNGVQELAEIIGAQLPMAWISFQGAADESVVPLVRQFDTLSGFVGENGLGYGIERCLYELDSSTPCAGPLPQGRLILDAKALLLALESFATRSDRPKEPIDRHVAAFLATRHARLINGPMMVLSPDAAPERRCAALIDLYDVLQRRASVEKLPQLCRWLASLAEPVIAGFHSRSLREKLKSDLDTAWKTGRIHDLKAIVGDAGLAERDGGSFRAAASAYVHATRSIEARRRELERVAQIAGRQGRQAAAIIASLLSTMMAVGAVVMAVL